MIPLNFYRDDEYVYYNNPNGITKKMTIAEFEAMMSGESELPTHSSSDNGKVLSVDSDGDLEWFSLPTISSPMVVNFTESDGSVTCDKTYNEILSALSSNAVIGVYHYNDGHATGLCHNYGTDISFVIPRLIEYVEPSNMQYSVLVISSDNTITLHEFYVAITVDD